MPQDPDRDVRRFRLGGAWPRQTPRGEIVKVPLARATLQAALETAERLNWGPLVELVLWENVDRKKDTDPAFVAYLEPRRPHQPSAEA